MWAPSPPRPTSMSHHHHHHKPPLPEPIETPQSEYTPPAVSRATKPHLDGKPPVDYCTKPQVPSQIIKPTKEFAKPPPPNKKHSLPPWERQRHPAPPTNPEPHPDPPNPEPRMEPTQPKPEAYHQDESQSVISELRALGRPDPAIETAPPRPPHHPEPARRPPPSPPHASTDRSPRNGSEQNGRSWPEQPPHLYNYQERRDSRPRPVAGARRESESNRDISPRHDPEPRGESQPRRDSNPRREVEPVHNFSPQYDSDPRRNSGPHHDSNTRRDSNHRRDSDPRRDTDPRRDSDLRRDSNMRRDSDNRHNLYDGEFYNQRPNLYDSTPPRPDGGVSGRQQEIASRGAPLFNDQSGDADIENRRFRQMHALPHNYYTDRGGSQSDPREQGSNGRSYHSQTSSDSQTSLSDMDKHTPFKMPGRLHKEGWKPPNDFRPNRQSPVQPVGPVKPMSLREAQRHMPKGLVNPSYRVATDMADVMGDAGAPRPSARTRVSPRQGGLPGHVRQSIVQGAWSLFLHTSLQCFDALSHITPLIL